jgi:RNA polymerase sigma factor (sigma-70 family)
MAAASDTLLWYLRRLVASSEPDEATDAALLNRFISGRDERAFAALVDRHGPLVFHVCQRVLGEVHDAEDAFQAAFLVLARKAATVRPREALPAWLHGVARRVALKARCAKTRQFRGAGKLAVSPADPRPDPLAEISGRELLMIIDEELQRLAEVYRLPVILCCLEGRSLEQAARQLGWTPGSVKGRLERGRARLHERLRRRGLTLSAALAAIEVSRGAASAVGLAQLVARPVRGAVAAEGIPPGVAALAGETLKGMTLSRLKVVSVLLLTICLVAAGLVLYPMAQPPAKATAVARRLPLPQDPLALDAAAARADDDDVPIEITGRVLDPKGKPFGGAKLYVGYSVRTWATIGGLRIAQDFDFQPKSYPLRATSGPDGRFRFVFARSELDARTLDDSLPAVVAVAAGYGPDWMEITASNQGAELSLALVEDLPLDGRILDQNRQPVAWAKVLVREVDADSEEGMTRYLRGNVDSWYPRRWRGPFPEQPPSATTNADGRFRIVGLGRDRVASLAVDGPAIRHTVLTAVTRPSPPLPNNWRANGATFENVALPAQRIRGVVRDQATVRPFAGVRVCALPTDPPTFTDEKGRFEIPWCPKNSQGQGYYMVMAEPQTGQPYFAAKISVPDRPGFDPLTADLDLTSGIPLSGRVMDQATGKPPRAAVVEYYPLFPNAHCAKLMHCSARAASSALIQPDGSYSLAVLPGPGVVCVAASPRNSYAVARVDDKELANFFRDRPEAWSPDRAGTWSLDKVTALARSQQLLFATGEGPPGILSVSKHNALSLINPDERADFLTLDLPLQPARTLQGTVVGPDGKPLTGVEVMGLTALPDGEKLESASFTVRGLNPRRSRDLVFHHREKSLGKVLTIRGDETEPLSVQLDPCGAINGRLVDKNGKPASGVPMFLSLRGGPGFQVFFKTDRDGCFHVDLLPGQAYSLTSYSSHPLLRSVGEVKVESGQSKDLGDLTLRD